MMTREGVPAASARRAVGGLYVVSGAPGSGKSTLVPALVASNTGSLVIADMDELLTDGALLGVPIETSAAASQWPAYNAVWARIIDLILRSGVSMLLLCPLVPRELPALETAAPTHWLLLDCSDGERRQRLNDRGWNVATIDAAIDDARRAREVLPVHLTTDRQDPMDTARAILRWVGCPHLVGEPTENP